MDGGESPLPPFVFLLVFDCIGYSYVIVEYIMLFYVCFFYYFD